MHLSRSRSRIVMVTLGIRIMANLPAPNDGLRRVDHLNQSGHFYLAERGHFYLAVTVILRIMYIMLNYASTDEGPLSHLTAGGTVPLIVRPTTPLHSIAWHDLAPS